MELTDSQRAIAKQILEKYDCEHIFCAACPFTTISLPTDEDSYTYENDLTILCSHGEPLTQETIEGISKLLHEPSQEDKIRIETFQWCLDNYCENVKYYKEKIEKAMSDIKGKYENT